MKFPNDVRHAEKLVGGNPDIVDKEQFQPKKAVPAQSKYAVCVLKIVIY